MMKEAIIGHKNKRASVLWPEIYSECNGKFI